MPLNLRPGVSRVKKRARMGEGWLASLPEMSEKMRGGPVSRILSRVAPGMTIHLGLLSPTGSCCQPGPRGQGRPMMRSLFGIAPGGACRAGPVARPAVGSYPTVSPLSRITSGTVCFLWRFPSGCPGRALPGTVALWSPDFPPCDLHQQIAGGHPALRASVAVKRSPRSGQRESTGKRRARSAASAASAASAGPLAHGRKRRRKAVRISSGAASGG